jgi:phosphoglycolate phosphatase
LSGNLRSVAQVKLETFGLDGGLDLDVGAYGSDDTVRSRLVPIAQCRAGRKYQASFDAQATVLIGDTPADARAGHEGGARVVAVASGRNTVDELSQAGAEVVLLDLHDSERLVHAVLGPGPAG